MEGMRRSMAIVRLSEVITEAEWRLLADQPSRISHTGIRNLAILHAMYFAGLGFADVCELSPWDLSERSKGIFVPSSRSDRRRLVSLSGKSWTVMEDWDDARPPSPYFFSTLRGNRLDEQYVRGFLRRYGDRAGIIHPTRVVAASRDPGFLERSYAGRLLARGLPEKGVARSLSGALR
jgi:site-specific recombinase XerD